MRAFNLDPEQNWSEGAPCSDDGTGSGFKGVICDSNGNPRAMIPTLGNSLVGLRSLPTAFARLTTLTRLVLIMGLINTRLDDFARPLSCLPNLRHLVLDGNSFYGPVPPYLINSPTLTDLDWRTAFPALAPTKPSAASCFPHLPLYHVVTGQQANGHNKGHASQPHSALNFLTAPLSPASRVQHQAFEHGLFNASWSLHRSLPWSLHRSLPHCLLSSPRLLPSLALPSPFFPHSPLPFLPPRRPSLAARQRRLLRLTRSPAVAPFRSLFSPPIPAVPGAPMFPMGAAGGGDSGEAEEGRRKERERREELIAAVREGRGSWQEVAAAIRQLQQAGMTAEEVADVAMLAHGRVTVLVVAAQVYESLLPGPQEAEGEGPDSGFDVVGAFQSEQSSEMLYELRTLPTAGRRQAAAYVAQQGLDAGEVTELVRAMRDHARRSNSREGFSSAPGDYLAFMCFRLAPLILTHRIHPSHPFLLPCSLPLQGFSSAPGDCLAFMCFRAAGETSGEERREWVEKGLAAAESESARARLREL
ncbi:unnamed protein product [Closterium sp. Naga37s-1]|nr:unnamed protein product [Closterium sp. Naga37s-1]